MIAEMLSHGFMIRALLVGTLVSLCSSLLGVTLVLKRYSMIGDGLSHVAFGAMAAAAALNSAPLVIAIPTVMATAFLLLRIGKSKKMNGDAAVAIISSGALAAGVLIMSMSSGMNTDVYNYMFGSILSVDKNSAVASIVLSAAVIALYILCYNRVLGITFDETFSKACGIKTELYNAVTALLTAVTVVIGMRIMGAMLISSLIIFPAVTSMKTCRVFRSVVITAGAVSVFCFIAGMIFSYRFEAPSGASVVAANAVMLLIFSVAGKIKKPH